MRTEKRRLVPERELRGENKQREREILLPSPTRYRSCSNIVPRACNPDDAFECMRKMPALDVHELASDSPPLQAPQGRIGRSTEISHLIVHGTGTCRIHSDSVPL